MKYFTIDELCSSSTAAQKGIDNTPPAEAKRHLTELADKLLDPLREDWAAYCRSKGLGKEGISVTSGYRCPELNKAVGGAGTSAHIYGFAADLVPANGKTTEFIRFCKSWAKAHTLDQCIDEYGRWCHMTWKSSKGKQRNQVFDIR